MIRYFRRRNDTRNKRHGIAVRRDGRTRAWCGLSIKDDDGPEFGECRKDQIDCSRCIRTAAIREYDL